MLSTVGAPLEGIAECQALQSAQAVIAMAVFEGLFLDWAVAVFHGPRARFELPMRAAPSVL